MSEQMDPEDVKGLAQRCVAEMSEEVSRHGGTVIDVMGDGVLAVFGAPVAHEDDAERAVRTGLAIRDRHFKDARGTDIPVHVGINTGEVMAGGIGPAERRQYAVLGDTTNTASRLTSAAPAGSVFVGAETYRATQRRVRFREVAAVSAKGKREPIAAWEALGVGAVPEARPLRTTPLVGRDSELALISQVWAKVVRESRPHLVIVVGEAGIGKSRFVAEVERRVLSGVSILHGRCLPYGEALGYWALATALRGAAGIAAEDDAATARAKLGSVVAEMIGPGRFVEADPRKIARHLALLSGLDTPTDRQETADQRTLHASASRFVEALARRGPVCLMFEDIHWADAALLDLVEFVAARTPAVPLMIVAQARPELLEKRPAWGHGVRGFVTIPLEPLDEREASELLQALCHERGVTEVLARELAAAAGGNPLFCEELVATVNERGVAGLMPSSIKLLIQARLDALPASERRILQRAAVFGKAFWEGGLRAVGVADPVGEQLESLEGKDLIRSQPRSQLRGEREYLFKHDLIRDVAYEMLPRSDRRMLHGRAAAWLELAGGDRLDELLSVLAHHAVQAEEHTLALDYLDRAAERARVAVAHREEAALLAQAIEVAGRAGRSDLMPDLRARRGRAFVGVGLWVDARRELEAALAAIAPDDNSRRAELLIDISMVCFWSIDTSSLRRYATEAVALAQTVSRSELQAGAMAWLAESQKVDGEIQASLETYRAAIELAGGIRAPALANAPLLFYLVGRSDEAVRYGRESVDLVRSSNNTAATMYVLPHLGLALAASGRYNEALRVFEDARRFGREHEAPFLARAVSMSTDLRLSLFDFEGAEQAAQEARELAASAGFNPTVVSAGIDLLFCYARRGDVARAEQLLGEVAEAVATTANWHGWLWRLRLAEARAEVALARGASAEAIASASDAIQQSHAKGRVKYEILGHATRGSAYLALGQTELAVADLQRAVTLARTLRDPALLLRASALLLPVAGSDALAAEAHRARDQIIAELPHGVMRQRFENAELVRTIARLSIHN